MKLESTLGGAYNLCKHLLTRVWSPLGAGQKRRLHPPGEILSQGGGTFYWSHMACVRKAGSYRCRAIYRTYAFKGIPRPVLEGGNGLSAVSPGNWTSVEAEDALRRGVLFSHWDHMMLLYSHELFRALFVFSSTPLQP